MRPEGRPLILHLLLHVGNFLVEGQVGVLQVLDLGDQGLDPGLGLGQLVGSIVVRTPEKTTTSVFLKVIFPNVLMNFDTFRNIDLMIISPKKSSFHLFNCINFQHIS